MSDEMWEGPEQPNCTGASPSDHSECSAVKVVADSDLRRNDRLIAYELAAYDPAVWPSTLDLATRAGLSPAAVDRSLDALRARGLIEVIDG